MHYPLPVLQDTTKRTPEDYQRIILSLRQQLASTGVSNLKEEVDSLKEENKRLKEQQKSSNNIVCTDVMLEELDKIKIEHRDELKVLTEEIDRLRLEAADKNALIEELQEEIEEIHNEYSQPIQRNGMRPGKTNRELEELKRANNRLLASENTLKRKIKELQKDLDLERTKNKRKNINYNQYSPIRSRKKSISQAGSTKKSRKSSVKTKPRKTTKSRKADSNCSSLSNSMISRGSIRSVDSRKSNRSHKKVLRKKSEVTIDLQAKPARSRSVSRKGTPKRAQRKVNFFYLFHRTA